MTIISNSSGRILAIDPGSKQSGYVVFCKETRTVIEAGKIKNQELLIDMKFDTVIIESFDYMVTNAGLEVVDAIIWIGRFFQHHKQKSVTLLYGRKAVKDRFGVKKDADTVKLLKNKYTQLVKVTKDAWQALLLIHYHLDHYGQ